MYNKNSKSNTNQNSKFKKYLNIICQLKIYFIQYFLNLLVQLVNFSEKYNIAKKFDKIFIKMKLFLYI